jgi:hypothetical protein
MLLKTKRQLGKRLLGGSTSTRMTRAKLLIKRESLDERLGIGIAIENNDSENRLVILIKRVFCDVFIRVFFVI